jgi:2'-5' RNA ligase
MPDEKPVRSFIAITLPQDMRDAARSVVRRLEASVGAGPVRWARAEQLHLTLKFLGGVEPGRLGELSAALDRACAGRQPFELCLDGLGCFPSARRPRVIWLGLGGDVTALATLHARIEDETGPFGAHEEAREFVAHLTLGRIKTTRPGDLRRIASALEAVPGPPAAPWTVRSVDLMKSTLLPGGAVHETVHSSPLSGAES